MLEAKGRVRVSRTLYCGEAEQWQEQRGEGKVAEVVGAELELEVVRGGLALGRTHDTGVVDEQVDGLTVVEEALGECGWRRGWRGLAGRR
jgi:hypothetical protein